MANSIPRLLDDPRPIKSVQGGWSNDDPQVSWQVPYVYGKEPDGTQLWSGNCDKIEVYGENGQGAVVPWFAVLKDEQIIARVDAQGLQVTYDVPAKEKS